MRWLIVSSTRLHSKVHCSCTNKPHSGRLLFLDNTLKGIIQRFEDEYPETRIPLANPTADNASDVSETFAPNSLFSSSNSQHFPTDPNSTATSFANSATLSNDSDEDDELSQTLRRRHNDVSLAARALSIEEGQALKLDQQLKRTLLKPQSQDYLYGTSGSAEEADAEPEHVKALRAKLEALSGEEWKAFVERQGVEGAMKTMFEKAEYLRKLQEEDPGQFAKVRDMIMQKLREKEGDLGGGDDDDVSAPPVETAEVTVED